MQTVTLQDADYLNESELAQLPTETLRDLFKRYRRSAEYLMGSDYVKANVSADSPAGWVVAVRSLEGKCHRCNGSGVYCWGGTINGRTVHSARCARCAGKGRVNNNDCRRAYVYDQHAIRRAFGF